jgi:acetyltransferase-like isoleucine patch superfamily enzyme
VRGQLWRCAAAARSLLWSGYLYALRRRGPRAAARAVMHCPPLLRVRILRAFGASIGEGTCIHAPFVLMNAGADFSNLRVGSDCFLGPNLVLDLSAPIRIGDRVAIAAGSCVATHLCVGASRLRALFPSESAPVVIGDDAYLGTGSVLLHGVEIGAGSVVAAGSVVRRPVPPATLVAGIPSRVVRAVELP